MPWEPNAYKDYRWIVADPQLLGGKLAIHGPSFPRLSAVRLLWLLSFAFQRFGGSDTILYRSPEYGRDQ